MKIYLCRSGQTYGPYSENSILAFLEDGLASKNDWAWVKGQNNWFRLEELLPLLGPQKSHNQEVEEQVSKIKNLVEKGQANAALDLVLGLQSQDVITELLEDCRIIQEDGVPDLPDWIIGSPRSFLTCYFISNQSMRKKSMRASDLQIFPSSISIIAVNSRTSEY